MEVESSSLVEGIGDEVLVTAVVCGIGFLVSLAWFSTNLTNTQTRLTSLRIRRQGVTLNRVPGSSIAEMRAAQQRSSETPPSPDSTTDVTSAEVTEPVTASADNPPSEGPQTDITESGVNEVTTSETVQSAATSATSTSTEECDSSDMGAVSRPPPPADSAEEVVIPTIQNAELTPPAAETSTAEGPAASAASPDSIQIRLKFLTDVERIVRAKKEDTIAQFKQAHFSTELTSNKLVRLIYNGQVLADDRSLQSYNIANNTTVHALVSENTTPMAAPQTAPPEVVVFNSGVFFVPLFTGILSLIWYLRFEYGQFFNVTSTISLGCITAVFVFCLLAQTRPTPEPQTTRQERHYGVNVNGGATTTNS